MVFPCCLQECWRRMLYPWGCSPQRRDLWMFLECWLFPQVRQAPFTQRPTSLVVLLKGEPLSSYQLFWCLLGSSQIPLLLWDFPQELTPEQETLYGIKPKPRFYRWIHWLQNNVGFEWKPSPKGFKKHDSVMPLGWGRVVPWRAISIFRGHQAGVDLSHCARRILCKTKRQEARYVLLSEWQRLR